MRAQWFNRRPKTNRFFLTVGLLFLFLLIIGCGGYFLYQKQAKQNTAKAVPVATRFSHQPLEKLDQTKLNFKTDFSVKPVDWVDVQLENKITVNNSGEKLSLTPIGADLSRREFIGDSQTEVIYREVYPGVDFKYSAASDHLKEDIIVKDQQSDGQFSFRFVLGKDLQLSRQDDGGYLIKKGESYLYYFYPFTAIDATGKKIDYQTSIVGEENNVFTIIAKPKKLADLQQASYPVTIDPTITWTFPLSSPTLSTVSPNSGPTAGGQEVTLTGTNFFGYKQTINVSYSGSTLTNFVGKFYLDTASLINAGRMRSDCGDLRVYQGNTKLSYQLISGCGTSVTQVNVLIPSISSSVSLDLYYGDTYLTTESTSIGPLTSFVSQDSLAYFAATLSGSETPTYQTITTRNASIPVEFYRYYGDQTISGTTYLGAAAADAYMLMARYEGNLTVNSGATLMPNTRKRGMVLYVDGTLTVNGTISMTARGAYNVAGQNILIFDENGVQYNIPANGASGGARVYSISGTASDGNTAGKAGAAGANGSTGGGGSGAANHGVKSSGTIRSRGYSGAGAAGTSYSGGAGGGGISRNNGNTTTYYAGNGNVNGGAGGAASAYRAVSSWAGRCAGGGAGNNGGAGASAGCTGNTGSAGTGGLLIVIAKNIHIGATGQVVAKGSTGGTASTATAGGGGSGGGSINLFYDYNYTYDTGAAVSAAGGSRGVGVVYGGYGGAGSSRQIAYDPPVLPTLSVNATVSKPVVKFGTTEATISQIVSSTTVKVIVPSRSAGAVTVSYTNFDTKSASKSSGYTYIAPPVVINADLASIPKTGSTTVNIYGANFYGTPIVTFNGVAATVIQVSSSNLRVVAPAGSVGPINIVVTNPDGQFHQKNKISNYVELAPSVLSINPTSGPTSGSTTVTISGSNFLPKNSGGESGWGMVASMPNGVYSYQTAVIGEYIYIFGGYGSNVTNKIYRAPISNPSNVAEVEGDYLPVNLYYFSLAVIGDYVYIFGGHTGSAYNYKIYRAPISEPTKWSDTGKTLPMAAYGSHLAVIGNYVYLFGGHNGSAYTNNIYSAPVSDPTTWTNTGKTLPAISYSGQLAVIEDNVYLFGGYNGSTYVKTIFAASTSNPTTWIDTGKTLPAISAYQQLAIIGDYVYLFGGYNNTATVNTIYKAPISDPTAWSNSASTLSTVLRNGQAVVINDYVYIFGGYGASSANSGIYRAPVQHFRGNLYNPSWQTNWPTITNDQSAVTIGGQSLNDVVFVNSNTITGVTPASAAGYYDVKVTNYDGQSSTLSNGYRYIPPPTISNVNPLTIPKNSSQTITISGDYFWGTPIVTFNGQAATSVELVNANTLSVVISGAAAGKASIRVTNPDGQFATFTNFTFSEPAPVISGGLTPDEGPYSGGTEVTLSGANFLPYRQLINVSYTGGSLTDYVEQLSLDTASLIAAGKMRSDCADIELRHGQISLERQIIDCNSEGTQIYVKVPQLFESTEIQLYYGNLSSVFSNASLTPTELAEGQSAPNFTIAEQVDGPIIKLGGVTSTIATINSANSISFITPPGNPGQVTATLTNYDNQVAFSAENAFEYLAGPQIASVSPLSAFANESIEMVISGSNFRNGAQIKFYSAGDESFSCANVIFDNGSTLRCQVDWSNRKWGYWHVEVTNPDGQVLTKNKAFYLNPLPPNVLSVQPSYGPMSGGTELTITGENFIGPAGIGYYREVLISYSGAALTNYRKVLTIDTKSLIDAGKMRSDCGDLRFSDSDGKTNLNYWLKSGCNTNNTQVVVAIPSISGDKTIYWRYGDLALTSISQVLGVDLAFWAKDLTGSTTVTNYTINTKYADIPVEFYNYTGDTTISSNTNLGSATADSRMLMARYDGSLTINSGATLTAANRKRGMVLYVNGDLTVNGTISMTARGAYNVAGQNVLILDENGVEYKIPAVGGGGGSRVYTIAPADGEAIAAGNSGGSSSSGGTGGGASGGSKHGGGSISAHYYRSRGYSGAGSAGTSYSGGSGGGGINRNNGNTTTYYAGDAGAYGGAGGAGSAYTAFAAGRAASGGAGNNGGAGSSAGETGASGSSGTGGLLILMVSGNVNIGNTGSIVSKGSNGGAAGAGGGASGGGSVNLFYGNQYQSLGTLSAAGGVGGGSPRGGHGGNGTVRTVKFSEDTYQIGPEYRLLSVELDNLKGLNPQIINSQTIKVTTPSTTVSGLVDIKVNNAGSQSVTLENSFFYLSDNYVLVTKPENLRVGQAGQFTIQARDVYGNVVAGADDVVFQLLSNSATGFFARDLNESLDTRWNYITTIMPAGSSEATFYYYDNQKGNVTLSITPVVGVALTPLTYSFSVISQYRFLVTGISDPIKVGVPSSVTIQAVNAEGSPLYDYTGTVAFSSTDNSAILPPNATFSSRNLGGRTLVNAVTFLTENQGDGWCFNVTDVNDPNINGSQCAITVGAPNIGIPAKIGFITDPQFIEVDSASMPITVQLQDIEGSPVSKTTSTTLYLYSQSETGQFSLNGLDSWVSEPLAVTVPPYASSINVYYRDSVLGNYSITASDDNVEGAEFGLTNATQAINVVVGGAYSFHIAPISLATTAGGEAQEFTVSLKDSSGNIVTSLNNQAFFVSASNSGLVSLNGLNWSTQVVGYINAGLSSQTFYFQSNKSGNTNVVVSDTSPANGAEGLTDASATVTVQPSGFSKLNIAASNIQLVAGQPSSAMTVQALDQYNNLVNVSANTSVYLYKNQPEIDFSGVADFSSTLDNIVIPTGQSSAKFYLKARTNIDSAIITASDGTPNADGEAGLGDDILNVDITPGSLHHFAITNSAPINLTAGNTELISLEGRNTYNVNVPSDLNRMIYFHASSSQALDEFSLSSGVGWSPISFAVLAKNSSTINVYYKPIKSGSRQLIFGDDNNLAQDQNVINATASVNIAAGAASRLNIADLSTNLLAGQKSSLATVSLTDGYGNLVDNNQDRTVNLSSSLASGYFFGANNQTTTSVVIPYGQATSSFYYLSTMAGNALVTAADQEFLATSSIVVDWGDITTFAIEKEQNTVKAGTSTGPIAVRSVNNYGITIPFAAETIVNFNSTATSTGFFDFSQTGLFDGSVISQTLAAGSSTLNLFYKDTKAGEPWLTFSTLAGIEASTTLTVLPDDEYQLSFVEGGEQVLEVGQKSSLMRLSVQDKYKNPIKLSAPRTVNLLTTSAKGGFATSTANTFNLASITIPADSTSTEVYYQDIEAGSPMLQATTMDLLAATTTTTVNPAQLTTINLTTATNYLTAGQASEAITLTLYNDFGQPAASSSDITINLTSDFASGKFATSTANEFNLTNLVVPAGATTTTFYYTDTIAGSKTITAATTGLTSGHLNLTVEADIPAALSFITSPQTITAGTSSSQIVVQFLDNFGNVKALAAPTTVALDSTAVTGGFSVVNTGPWTYTEVTGEIGATAVIFYYRDTKSGTAGLSVSSASLTSDNQNITINPAVLDHFRFSSSAQSLKALQVSSPITVEALDQFNNLTKPTSTVNFNLTTTSTKGYFSSTNDPWSTTTAAQLTSSHSSFIFYYYDSSLGQPQITVQDTNNSYPAISQTETIITGDVGKLVFASSPQTVIVGTVSELVNFNLTDLAGNTATSSVDTIVTITSTSTTALFKDTQAESLWSNSFALTIPAGQSSGSFYFQDTTPGQTIITLAADGLVGASLVEELVTGYPAKIDFSGAAIFSAGVITPITVQLKNDNDLIVPALASTTIDLANNVAGEFSLSSSNWQAITSLEIPTGSSEKTVYFRATTAGNGQITASENPDSGLIDGLLNIEINPAGAYRLKIINKPETIVVNQPSTVFTAQLQDEFGNIVNLTAAEIGGAEVADIYLHGTGQFATTTTGVWGIGSVPLRVGESAVSFYYQGVAPGSETVKVSDQALNQGLDTGWLDDSAAITILGETPSRLSLSATSWTVAAGQALPITVTALKENNQPAILGEDLVVDLSANWVNGRFLLTPDSASSSLTEITIPAGQNSVQLYAKHTLVGTYVVSANANALSGASQQLKIKAASASVLKFISSEQTVVAGQDSAALQIRLVDSYGNPATSTSQRLIGFDSTGGDFSLLSGVDFATTTTATVPAGSSDLTFYWRNYRQAGLFNLTVNDLSGQVLQPAEQNITVTAAVANRFVISSQPINIMTGEISPLIAFAVRDEYGNSQVLPANATVYLYSTSTKASFSQVANFATTMTSFVLPAGSSGGNFYYRDLAVGQPVITIADQPLYVPGDPDLSLIDAKQTATIVSGPVAKLKFIDSPSVIRSGDSRLYQVQLQNQFNQPTEATYPLVAYLYTSSAYGRFSTSTSFLPTDFITTLNFATGESLKEVYYRDTLTGEHTVTVADYVPKDEPDQGLTNAVRSQTVLSGDPVSLNFINVAQTLIAGQTSAAYTVELRDLYGNVATAISKVNLYLSSSSNLAGFATSSVASDFNLNQIAIPAGGSTASFYYQDRQENNPLITVSDQQPLDNPDTGLINATQSQTINWGDVFRIAITSPAPALEVGQVSAAQTVQLQNSYGLGRPAPAVTTLYLNTSNAEGGFATTSTGPFTANQLTIPAGQTTGTYYYRQLATGTAQLRISETAPANGPINWLDAEQTIEVVAGEPHRIIVAYAPETVIAKHPSTEINVQIYNSSGYPTTDHEGIRLYLRSSSLVSGTEFAAAATGPWGINFVTVPAGQSSVSVYYRSPKLGTNVLTIADELPAEEGVGLINATVNLEVLTRTIDNFLVTNISDPQVQGTPSSVVVWARDADNYIFEQYSGQICFTSSDVTAILPDCYTFIPEIDHGMHSFINAVTFPQVGEKWVRATALSGQTGVQQNITVTGNSAGTVHHLSFSNVSDNLIRLSQEEVVGPITVQLFDVDNQPVNASEGGYPVHLKTSSATGQFAVSADGPWVSELDQVIPAGISSFNFYYRDYINGSSVVVASDWIDGLNNTDVGDATLVAEVTGLQIEVSKVIEGHSVRQALWTANPMIFSNQNSGRNYEGRATFDIAIKDFNSGNPQTATVDLVLKNPAGQVVATSTLSGQANYTYQAYPLGGDGNYHIPENSGNWTLGITAVSGAGIRGVRTETIPVSSHLIEIDYQNIFAQKGKPIVFDIKVTDNNVLTDAEGIVLNWIDNNGNFIPGTTLNLNALTRTATGTYSGLMPTNLLTVGEKFYLGASLRNAQGHILAEDSHGDIQVVNNPALAAKNFTVEKIVTSIPPAPETYNLRFTWQSAASAVRYRLYYTQNKFARLFSDACSVAQVRAGGRTSSTCDTIINMSTSTNAAEDWYQFATVDEPATEYTIINAQNISFNPLYFLLRADNGNGQESGFSTMSFVNRLGFNYNSSLSNINWISIPYVPSYYTNSTALFSRQMLDKSSILIGDIEGGRGLNTNQKVKRVSLWDPATQGTIKNYTYRAGGAFNKWTGVDFSITPGGGIFLETSASVANFDWTMVGSDKQSAIDFVYNGPSATNIYWLSLPYSSMYGKASDIVSDIEGGTALGTNQKIKRISLWDPANQGTIKNYAYRAGGAFNKWTGVDFAINPGGGVFVELSGNTPEFRWTPALLVEPYN